MSEIKVEDVLLERAKFEYLYESAGVYAFMNNTSYEQIELSEDDIGDAKYYLTEGLFVDLQQFEGKFIGISLPDSVRLTVVETTPGVKGNTADGKVVKDATLNTGLRVKVPGFIEQGEEIIVKTETGEYQERAK